MADPPMVCPLAGLVEASKARNHAQIHCGLLDRCLLPSLASSARFPMPADCNEFLNCARDGHASPLCQPGL